MTWTWGQATCFLIFSSPALHYTTPATVRIWGQATYSLIFSGPALHYTTPASAWDEAIPLGNGVTGALVWGDGRPLKISLDRADLWDLRRVPEFSGPDYNFATMKRWHEQGRIADLKRVYEAPYERPAPTKIPAGRIELDFPGNFRSSDLDVQKAEATVAFDSGALVEILIHATEPVGLARFKGAVPRIRLLPPPFAGAVNDPARGGIDAGDLRQLGYPAPVESSGDGWRAYTQQGAEGFTFAVHVAWSGQIMAWSIASSLEGPDPAAIARTRVEAALRRGFDAMQASHRAWWSAFWDKTWVQVPNAAIQRQWDLDTYKFASAARRGAPPITLQAVWTADNGKLPPWKGDYHHDLNTQLSYWPAYSGNRLEEELSYLDWLWKTRDTAFEWTRDFFQLPGLNVPMTADLNGRQIGGWRQYTHSATTSAWLSHHFYLHWKYSADPAFLRDRAYPYLRDTAIFLEAFTRDGTFPLSASPEINDNRPEAWFSVPTNYDLALTRWLFSAAAEMAIKLDKPDEAARWQKALSHLPDFAFGDDGKLLVAPGYPLKTSHRHFSHLMAIHPLGLIRDPKIIQASLADLDRLGTDWWTGYSFAWLASLAARAHDGEKAARALETFATAFTLRNSFHCNGDQSGLGYSKFTYRPFTLEGNFAAAAGLQEMLLQSYTGTVELFPAIPQSWKDVEFHDLRAEGAFLVSARLTAGKVDKIEVLSERGGDLRLQWRDRVLTHHFRPGERWSPARKLLLGFKAGVPLTEYFQLGSASTQNGTVEYSAATRRYTFGAAAEWRPSSPLGLELGVMYKRTGYVGIVTSFNQAVVITDSIDTKGDSWEFPVLLKYRFTRTWHPFLSAGATLRLIAPIRGVGEHTVQNLATGEATKVPVETTQPGDLNRRLYPGIVGAGGLEFTAGRARLLPEFRYTRWTANINPSGSPLRLNPNQAEILLGFLF